MQSPYYFIESCSGNTSGVVDFGPYVPSTGEVYSLIFVNNVLEDGCYTIVSGDTEPVDIVSLFQIFESCDVCVNGVPVNEQYQYTAECCDPVSGATGPGSAVPHAIYATNLGVAIQSNTVELGGFNGLNN
jgi:hypothetical protein